MARFVTQTFGGLIGAERVIAQGLESLDECIAIRRMLAPRLEAWLAKHWRRTAAQPRMAHSPGQIGVVGSSLVSTSRYGE